MGCLEVGPAAELEFDVRMAGEIAGRMVCPSLCGGARTQRSSHALFRLHLFTFTYRFYFYF
jgi:hypothetical protein